MVDNPSGSSNTDEDEPQYHFQGSLKALRDCLYNTLDTVEARYGQPSYVYGLPTGFLDLDDRCGGLQHSNLIVVGSRPGVGKTSFALGVAEHVAVETREPVLLVTPAMSAATTSMRLVASSGRIDNQRLQAGKLLEPDWSKISRAIGHLAEAPIFIDDTPLATMTTVFDSARQVREQCGSIGLVVVDYVQLLEPDRPRDTRAAELAAVTRRLKALAGEMNAAVMCLSQVSRNVEMRVDKHPPAR